MKRITSRCVVAVVALFTSGCVGDAVGNVAAPLPSSDLTASHTMVLSGGEVGRIHRSASISSGPGSWFGPPASGVESYACDAFGDQWISDWKNAFVGVTTYREAAFAHQFVGTLTFYPGAQVANGTNTNSLTYLGACNGDMYGNTLTVNIERRVNGVWVNIVTVDLENFQRYTFASAIPAQYRGRATGANGVVIPHFGVGAAWNLTPLRKVN